MRTWQDLFLFRVVHLIYSMFITFARRNLARISLKTLTGLANSYYCGLPHGSRPSFLAGFILHAQRPQCHTV